MVGVTELHSMSSCLPKYALWHKKSTYLKTIIHLALTECSLRCVLWQAWPRREDTCIGQGRSQCRVKPGIIRG